MQDAIPPEPFEIGELGHVVQADDDTDDTGYPHRCNIDPRPVQTEYRQVNRRHQAKG